MCYYRKYKNFSLPWNVVVQKIVFINVWDTGIFHTGCDYCSRKTSHPKFNKYFTSCVGPAPKYSLRNVALSCRNLDFSDFLSMIYSLDWCFSFKVFPLVSLALYNHSHCLKIYTFLKASTIYSEELVIQYIK